MKMRAKIGRFLFFPTARARIVPISLKVTVLFSVLLLATALVSNYLSFLLNQTEQLHLLRELMVRDLERVMDFASIQFEREISEFSQTRETSIKNIASNAQLYLTNPHSLLLGVYEGGGVYMAVGKDAAKKDISLFSDKSALAYMRMNHVGGAGNFRLKGRTYYSVYKYSELWDIHFVRAEEYGDFTAPSKRIFLNVSILIAVCTGICMLVGIYSINHLFRYIKVLTSSIRDMEEKKTTHLVDVSHAANDDITYLSIAFNALSITLERLVDTFKRFVARDVAIRAYEEGTIPLGGRKQELVMLFTDIPRFSRMTEVLGTDIITLLNAHYNQVIGAIHNWHGDVNSIIGDALLAVFGILESGDSPSSDREQRNRERKENKYYLSLKAAFEIQNKISPLFKRINANVGIGITGGEVFYGTIGSPSRMMNTVIGDHVNFASRLERLTRWYKVPIICSEDVCRSVGQEYEDVRFVELDTVIVKGKTQKEKIFWVMDPYEWNGETNMQVRIFSKGLTLYYSGQWETAKKFFRQCSLPPCEIFLRRMETVKTPPKNWNGIWTMKVK